MTKKSIIEDAFDAKGIPFDRERQAKVTAMFQSHRGPKGCACVIRAKPAMPELREQDSRVFRGF